VQVNRENLGLPSASEVDQSSRLVWFSLVFNALPAELQSSREEIRFRNLDHLERALKTPFKLQTVMDDKGRYHSLGQDSARSSPRRPQVGFWKVSLIGNDKRASSHRTITSIGWTETGSGNAEIGFRQKSTRYG
jgi:hypothetical protein